MIFHTIYSITIGQFAEMLETGDINRCKRIPIWMPKKSVQKHYTILATSYNETNSEKATKAKINEGFDRLEIDTQILWYRSMEKMIRIWEQLYGEDKKNVKADIDELFKMKYGKMPERKDLMRIHKERVLLIEKAMQVYPTPTENVKIDFDTNLIELEKLSPVSLRDKKLYLLKKYIKSLTRKKADNGGN